MKLRSQVVTQAPSGPPRARCCARSASATRDFDKPIVGVANAYSTITPCNLGLDRPRPRAPRRALRAAGAMPQLFGTITVSDGISMGTEGMKYSLVSREVIADSIETVVNGAEHGRPAGDRRLRQEHAGRDDRDRAAERAVHLRLRRHHQARPPGRPGPHRSSARSRRSGSAAPGTIRRGELLEVERHACPGAGSCGGMYTANTMSSAIEAMGLSLPYSSTMAAEDDETARAPRDRAARVLADAIRRRPAAARRILTREAFENAIAVVMALGGSTNAVLHLLAIAHAAEVPLELDDFERDPRGACRCCATSSRSAATSRPTCTASAASRR